MTPNSQLVAEESQIYRTQPGLGMCTLSPVLSPLALSFSWAHTPRSHPSPLPVFHPEFGRFMLEATPGQPWGIEFKELLAVEPDMKLR